MLPSSRNVTFGSAARASFISENVSAVSHDSMPASPPWRRLPGSPATTCGQCRSRAGGASGGGLIVSDGVGERGRSGLAFVPGLGVGPNEHGTHPWHLPRAARCFAGSLEVKPSRRCQPEAGRRNPPDRTKDKPIPMFQALGSKGVILLSQ